MKTVCVFKLFVAAAVVVLSVGSAHADGGCDGTDTWANHCAGNFKSNICGSANDNCIIEISEKGGKATVMRAGGQVDAPVICVEKHIFVEFQETHPDGKAHFTLDFQAKDPKKSPFKQDMVRGDKQTTPALEILHNDQPCYAYQANHMSGGTTKSLDPKIIVGGGGGRKFVYNIVELLENIAAKFKAFLKGIGLL